MPEFTIDLGKATTPFPHYWEECVGSGHAALALRADWQRQIAQCKQELGFKAVRFHGLLCDDMSTRSGTAEDPYSFHNTDLIFDFLLSVGMKPFVELSFMPEQLASGPETIFHYKGNITPPKNYEDWADLIGSLVQHLVDRYGIEEVASWNFEVWNEPNLIYFWSGSQAEYFKLYSYAARAIKEVDARLRVGGPATAANGWIRETLDFCRQNGVPLDFVSTHHYPTDVALGHDLDMETSMAKAPRGTVTAMAKSVRAQVGDLPLYYTEWSNSPSCRDRYHDDPYGAAFLLKSIADNAGIVDIYAYWTFSDIFEELYFSSTPFHGGFGLLNIHGIPKPAYQAFRLLHLLGEERLAVVTNEPTATAECLAVKDGQAVGILVYNHDVPRSVIKTEAVRLLLTGLAGTPKARMARIDAEHHNPRKQWEGAGAKEVLSAADVAGLMEDAALTFTPVEMTQTGQGYEIRFAVPPQGIVGVFIE
jgi:xylan 1,4-beta-xylosidase